MAECDICGREFDTERGMHIHRRQAHPDADQPDEDTGTKKTTEKSASFGNLTLNLKVTHAVFAAFIIGIFAGGFFTASLFGAAGVTGMLADGPSTVDGGGQDDSAAPQDGSDSGPWEEVVDTSQLDLSNDPSLGDPDAPVTLILYEDYQCPFCKRFEQNTVPRIKQNYVDSGQVRLVWKDIPLPQLGHDWAEPAAAAMECVYREGGNDVFWPVKDKLFSTAKTLTRGEDEYTPDTVQPAIVDMAVNEGASRSAIEDCLANGNPMDAVNTDKSSASAVGVSGTPTILVNDKKVVGAQPYEVFEAVIESELS